MLKCFILSFFAVYSIVSGGDNGWFSVEKAPQAKEESPERDSSIWVLFSKTIGLEKILVQFPEDPVCLYTESGMVALRSEKEGEIFELNIEPVIKSPSFSPISEARSKAPPASEVLYLSEGKWVHMHVIQTEHNMYSFRTYSNQLECPNHTLFISSFVLQ